MGSSYKLRVYATYCDVRVYKVIAVILNEFLALLLGKVAWQLAHYVPHFIFVTQKLAS